MERLFAPWRHAYVTADEPADSGGCILCEAPGMSEDESLVVHRGTRAYVLMNLYPYSSEARAWDWAARSASPSAVEGCSFSIDSR